MPASSNTAHTAPALPRDTSFGSQSRALLGLGLPLMFSHVAQFALNVSDSVMLGWYSATALAAGALGANIFFVIFTVGSGFGHAVMPLVAAAAARGDTTEVRRVTRMGIWLALAYGLLVLPLFIFSEFILAAAGQDAQVAAMAGEYLAIVGFGLWASLMVMVLKSFLVALGRTQVVLWTTLGALAINIPLNWMFIFGNLGMPELGVRGAAITSVTVQIASLLFLAAYALRDRELRRYALATRLWRADWQALGRVFALGLPIGLAMFAETGLFAASAVMMGWLGPNELAAHAIALEITALFFMVHLGLSNAATVMVGRARGMGARDHMRAAARTGTIIALSVAVTTMGLYILFGEQMVGLFLAPGDPDRAFIVPLGVTLLMVAAVFQLADGSQAMAMGLLRGIEDTRVPMLIAAVSYWIIGLPTGYLLGFTFGLEGVGLWIGLVAGLSCAAIALMTRFWRKLERLDLSPPAKAG